MKIWQFCSSSNWRPQGELQYWHWCLRQLKPSKIYCDHLQTEINYKSKTQGELPKQCGVRSKKGRVSLRRACSWSSGGFAPIFSTLSSSLWCHFVVEVNLIIDITYFKFWLLCCHFHYRHHCKFCNWRLPFYRHKNHFMFLAVHLLSISD